MKRKIKSKKIGGNIISNNVNFLYEPAKYMSSTIPINYHKLGGCNNYNKTKNNLKKKNKSLKKFHNKTLKNYK